MPGRFLHPFAKPTRESFITLVRGEGARVWTADGRELVARGVREVALLGQIVTSYAKRDLPVQDGRSAFVQLLDAVHTIEGLERIRFTSPHPRGFKDDLVAAYGRLPKLCEYVHLPMQSGSDRILRAMNRPYTRDRYRAIVDSLRAVNPAMHFSTDVIVGFPGETDEDFARTVERVERVAYDNVFAFRYSRRPGTPAADRFDLLALVIEDYERKRWPIEPPDPVDAVRWRMQAGGFTQAAHGIAQRKAFVSAAGAHAHGVAVGEHPAIKVRRQMTLVPHITALWVITRLALRCGQNLVVSKHQFGSMGIGNGLASHL